MSQIVIEVPDDLAWMNDDLSVFFSGMIEKLYANKHKQMPQQCDIVRFMLLIQKELLEVHEQWILDKHDPNMAKELHDVANFALLIFAVMRAEQGTKNGQED